MPKVTMFDLFSRLLLIGSIIEAAKVVNVRKNEEGRELRGDYNSAIKSDVKNDSA